jgi:hypothetical protein
VNTVERTGIDAALGIDKVQDKLEYMIKGQRNPMDYFDPLPQLIARAERLPCRVPEPSCYHDR